LHLKRLEIIPVVFSLAKFMLKELRTADIEDKVIAVASPSLCNHILLHFANIINNDKNAMPIITGAISEI